MKVNNKTIHVFDNEGETFDRFTIILPDGEMLGSSVYPFHPQGFGMYVGNVCENVEGGHNNNYYDYVNGTGWDPWYVNTCLKKYLRSAKSDPAWLGKEVKKFEKLPVDVQRYINQMMVEVTV